MLEMRLTYDPEFGIIFFDRPSYDLFIQELTKDCRIVTFYTICHTALSICPGVGSDLDWDYINELQWKCIGWLSEDFVKFPLVEIREGYYISLTSSPEDITKLPIRGKNLA